jgi:hypothetical protein
MAREFTQALGVGRLGPWTPLLAVAFPHEPSADGIGLGWDIEAA